MGHAGHHRLTRTLAAAAAAGSAAVAALAGCGSEGPAQAPAPGRTGEVPVRGDDREAIPPGVPVRIVRAELVAHRVGADDRTLEVVFVRSGSERFRRADVRLTPRAVRVAVELRSPKRGIDFDARFRCARVVLEEPLAGRPVRNARTGRPLPTFASAPLAAKEAVEVVCG